MISLACNIQLAPKSSSWVSELTYPNSDMSHIVWFDWNEVRSQDFELVVIDAEDKSCIHGSINNS